jgi:hypothetical protein
MLFSHTNTIFEITMTTFAVSFAVNEQNGRRMERLNQALGPIKSTRHLVSSQIPPSACRVKYSIPIIAQVSLKGA